MESLDIPQSFSDIDKENMLKHIEELPDQIEKAWQDMQDFVIPAPYIKVKNVVILGMGGSGIGAMLAKYLAYQTSKAPIEVVHDYTLPKYAGTDTLVIGVSYSGNTEETVEAFTEAGKRQCKVIAITMGGEISSVASRFKAPVYRINYGSPPRAALGFTYIPVLGILNRLGFIELGKEDMRETVVLMKGFRAKMAPDIPTYQNDAKKLAHRLQNVIPVMIGSGILAPVAYRWFGQMAENGKHFGSYLEMPELCHNWISGLKFPNEINKALLVIILQSKYDHPRNRLRQNILAQILRKNSIEHELVFIHPSGSPLSEQMLSLYMGDYVSYYLAMLDDADPTVIEEVVYLKKQLEQGESKRS